MAKRARWLKVALKVMCHGLGGALRFCTDLCCIVQHLGKGHHFTIGEIQVRQRLLTALNEESCARTTVISLTPFVRLVQRMHMAVANTK